jgi:riboflavin biosynthesis pyrimidine reductase
VRRLLPDCAPTSVDEQIGELDLISLAHKDRPYLITNFVLSLDGQATLEGRSGPLGSDADTAMLVALRTRVDALMIGAGTMRVERYGRPVGDPAKRERRQRDGLAPDPLMVIVSGRLDLPWEAPLFAEPSVQVVICSTADAKPPETPASVEIVRQPDAIDLPALMAHLRGTHDVRALLCEGGPHLHADLLEDDLVDELYVTRAAKLAGGDGLGLATGLPEANRPLELAWLLHEESTGELFGRYRVVR